jgi:hypothetical protein
MKLELLLNKLKCLDPKMKNLTLLARNEKSKLQSLANLDNKTFLLLKLYLWIKPEFFLSLQQVYIYQRSKALHFESYTLKVNLIQKEWQ